MARPFAPVWQVLDPELLRLLRLLYGLPDYELVQEMDSLPESEWRRLMEEPPRPGGAGGTEVAE